MRKALPRSPVVGLFIFLVVSSSLLWLSYSTLVKNGPASLSEKSAIHESLTLKKSVVEESKKATEALGKQRARIDSARALAKKLGVSQRGFAYIPLAETVDNGDGIITIRVEDYDFYLNEARPDFRDTVKNAYSQCVENAEMYKVGTSGEKVDLECVFTAFMLDRVSKNEKLMKAFTAAQREKVKIELTAGSFYIDPGVIGVDVLANDAVITDFLVKDTGVVKKK